MGDRLRAARRLSVLDGMLHAVMLGTGESYLGALAVELGHGGRELALLVTVPMLCGALSQLAAMRLARLVGSRRRLVVAAAAGQALVQILFVVIATMPVRGLGPLLATKVLHWSLGMMIAPAWGAWMASLVGGPERARYFAWRTTAVYAALLGAFTLAGLHLHQAGVGQGAAVAAFAVLHGVAFVARAASAITLALQLDPDPALPVHAHRSLRRALRRSRWVPAGYLAAMMAGAYLSVPFYTPYMLRVLGMDYGTFALLTAIPLVVRSLASPLLHVAAARFGMQALMVGGGVGIALVALAWSWFTSFGGLAVAQVLSGLAWGATEYASFQLLIASAGSRWRVEFLSMTGTVTAAAQLAGGLVGTALLSAVGYRALFAISAAGRALPLLVLVPLLQGLPIAAVRLFTRILSVRPSGGVHERPIVTNRPPLPPARPSGGSLP